MTFNLKDKIVGCGTTYCNTFRTEMETEQFLINETDAMEVSIEYTTTDTTWEVNIYFTFTDFRKGDIELIKNLFNGMDYELSRGGCSSDCKIHIEGKLEGDENCN